MKKKVADGIRTWLQNGLSSTLPPIFGIGWSHLYREDGVYWYDYVHELHLPQAVDDSGYGKSSMTTGGEN